MTTCHTCSAQWTGLAVAHCCACHHSFSAVSTFDKHRKGSTDGLFRAGECSDPAARGMVRNSHGYWGMPGDPSLDRADFDETPRPRRGRPPGSKNRPKTAPASA